MMRVMMLAACVMLQFGCASGEVSRVYEVDSIRHAPRTTSPQADLADDELIDSARGALRHNHLSDASRLLATVAGRGRGSLELTMLEAEVLLRRQRLDAAADRFRHAHNLARERGDSAQIRECLTWLGFVQYDLGGFSDASRLFAKGSTNPRTLAFSNLLRSFGDRVPYRLAASCDSTTLAILDDDPYAKIEVAVNGRRSRNFIFDTGSNFVMISSDLARKCGVTSQEEILSGPSHDVPMTFAIVDSLRLGDFTVFDAPVLILDSRQMSFRILGITFYRLDGAIGMPLIKRLTVTVDQQARKMTLERAMRDSLPERTADLAVLQNVAYVQARIDGVPGLNFMIDSGTKHSAVVEHALSRLDSAQLHFEKPRRDTRRHVGRKSPVLADVTIRSIEIDGHGIEDFRLEVVPEWRPGGGVDVEIDGILARDFLDRFVVTYDFRNMRLTLKPAEHTR